MTPVTSATPASPPAEMPRIVRVDVPLSRAGDLVGRRSGVVAEEAREILLREDGIAGLEARDAEVQENARVLVERPRLLERRARAGPVLRLELRDAALERRARFL